MKLIIMLAWRNIWRNKRRTFISIASIFFAVVFALFMRATQLGSYEMMINNTVKQYTGYLQIHESGYKEKESIDLSYELTDSVKHHLFSIFNVKSMIPRLESFVLISTEHDTKGALLIGINPVIEDEMNGLKSKLISGQFLSNEDKSILVAEGLAKNLKLSLADTIILIGQGFHGVSAAAKYPIKGIIKYPIPEQNNSMMFLPLLEAQQFFAAEKRITSLAIDLVHPEQMNQTKEIIASKLPDHLLVRNWRELTPELVQSIEVDSVSGIFMICILYAIIGFGLFGTIMMMTIERKKEFASLIAIGMNRSRLIWTTFLEVFMLTFAAAVSAAIIMIPVIYYFNVFPIEFTGEMADMILEYGYEPIMPTSLDPNNFIMQSIIVSFLSIVTVIYPTLVIRKLEPVKAMGA